MEYVVNSDSKFGYSTLIDADAEAAACTIPWFNQTLTEVNATLVRLGVFHGEYHWHKHAAQDEFFFVLAGELYLDIEGADTVVLRRHQGYTVPQGVVHKTRAPQRVVCLMVEQRDGFVPSGD